MQLDGVKETTGLNAPRRSVTTSPPDPLHVLCEIGDAFTAGDLLSEWAVTVVMEPTSTRL